jgi:hypothetical protein|tara:strand:- start:87 stop:467 length:381 start_codon:yes stop_codon:yes gene_type:complete
MVQKFIIICFTILIVGSAQVMSAETHWPIVCDERHKIFSELEKKYHEKLRWHGVVQAITKDGGELQLVAQLLTAPDSWSFVLAPKSMGGDGLDMVCILASGKGDSFFSKAPGLSAKHLGGGIFGHQ